MRQKGRTGLVVTKQLVRPVRARASGVDYAELRHRGLAPLSVWSPAITEIDASVPL